MYSGKKVSARYSPTGHLIYVRGSALLAVPFDLTDLRVTGRPVSVVDGVYGEAGDRHAVKRGVDEAAVHADTKNASAHVIGAPETGLR